MQNENTTSLSPSFTLATFGERFLAEMIDVGIMTIICCIVQFTIPIVAPIILCLLCRPV
jgi:uncharacterized RDD family membrane protein YckC